MSVDERQPAASCGQCGAAVERCAFCDEEQCLEALCYRCVRINLGLEVPQPHGHGG